MSAPTAHWNDWGTLALTAILLGGCATAQRTDSTGPAPGEAVSRSGCWRFDEDRPGEVPNGWSVRQTNPTEALATWRVIRDRTAPSQRNVLALTNSRNYDGTYNLAIADRNSFADLDLTVQVKALEGEEDQGGGPIWRCVDEDNYYICRFNPLEGNYRVYRVVDGKRKQLGSVRIETRPERWYAVRAVMAGDQIECYLDGEKLLKVKDSTFPGAGMVGLWTKADAVTSFDDLRVTSLD
jgi:hypothetical protein